MKFTVDKEMLVRGIDTIQNVISAKATLPILSNFLLEAGKNTVRLTATDLNIGISCVIPVDTQEAGAITIPARRFSGIVKELSDSSVEVTAKKNNVVIIETRACQFKIIGLPHEEFPKLPEFKDKEAIRIEQSLLKEMVALTSFAVSLDETRYILNGILFTIGKDSVSLVATDGKRLAVCTKKLARPSIKEISMIVPIKTIQELQRNLTDDGEVALTIGANQVLFDINGTTVISRLIEGEFPDYKQVIPAHSDSRIRVNREQFLLAIRRAALLSTPDYQAVKFEVFKNKLVLSKSTPDVGESREELAMEYSGKEMIIGFNPAYLIDVLKNLDSDHVEMEISGSEKPGVVRADGYVYIVLPMRLG